MRSPLVRLLLPWSVLAVVGACTGTPPAPAVDTAAIQAAAENVDRAFAAAVAARDTDAVMALYTEDARLLVPGAPAAVGRPAIRATWAGFLATPGLEVDVRPGHVIVAQAGDLAVTVGSYTMRTAGPLGKVNEDVGKYVVVLRNTDAGWKIVVDTFNSDLAPPGP